MSTSEERAEIYAKFSLIIEANTKPGFEAMALEHDGLPVDIAIRGMIALFEFGLVLAERYPELAATIREAAREADEARGIPVSTEEAVDSVVERMK